MSPTFGELSAPGAASCPKPGIATAMKSSKENALLVIVHSLCFENCVLKPKYSNASVRDVQHISTSQTSRSVIVVPDFWRSLRGGVQRRNERRVYRLGPHGYRYGAANPGWRA